MRAFTWPPELQVELSDRLAHAGAVASPERLGARLLSAVGERPGSARAPVPPTDAVRKVWNKSEPQSDGDRVDG
jgi:hypothetical protein